MPDESSEVTAMTNAMTNNMRKTGIDVVGNMSWGTHFCLFYDTKADLLETLVSYCRAGLESKELCLWVAAPPVTVEEARQALRGAVPDFDQHTAQSSIEIVAARDWYLRDDGSFDLKRVIAGWNQKLMHASAKGYAGVRVTGDTAWLEKQYWKHFCEYEDALNMAIANQHLAALCTYPLAAYGAAEILDVVRTHEFAVTNRRGHWDVIETVGHKQAKVEIKRLMEELELRVIERTSQLTAVNEELMREVLERERSEETLRRTEAYLAGAQRLTRSGSWALNIDTHQVLHSSEEHNRLFGFDPDQLPAFEQFWQRVHPEDRDQVVGTLERASRTKSDVDLYYRIFLPDRTMRYVHAVAHPVVKLSGEVGELVGMSMDVTERRRADEERERLRQAQTDLAHVTRVTTMGELTASLAHEIKQPISAAITDARTCLRWLSRDEPDVSEASEAASRLIKDVTRASDIISRISLLFKKGAPQHELLDVNEVIREMIALLRSEASRYSISIHGELANDLPMVVADRVQLQQVFMNLMLNGIDAMKISGLGNELTIKSEAADGQLLISVRDTGIGIPPEEADQIFNAFFTTKPHGTGMGLSISRSIIESHGGRLWAAGNSGQGATFHLTLPANIQALE
jgi:signal transduction histidine kinase